MNNETAKFVLEEISPSSFLQQATNTFPTKSSSQKNWKVSYIGKLYSRKTDPKWGGYPFHVSEMSRTLYFSVLRWDISVVLWAKRQNVINLKLSSKKFGSRKIRKKEEGRVLICYFQAWSCSYVPSIPSREDFTSCGPRSFLIMGVRLGPNGYPSTSPSVYQCSLGNICKTSNLKILVSCSDVLPMQNCYVS